MISSVDTVRLTEKNSIDLKDSVAIETPVALVINGEPHVVMMASPDDLEDFAVGFCITENLISSIDDIHYLDVTPCDSGLQIHIRLTDKREPHQESRQRNLTGRTGCGLCGTALIEEAVRNTPVIDSNLLINQQQISDAVGTIDDNQPVKSKTGAVHAAAWFSEAGDLNIIREDVGRHNALDKLVGNMHSSGKVIPNTGFIVITSRASYEMVTKTAFAGIAVLAAVSAPTSLAIEIAEKSHLTLVGFARDESCVIYTHPERIARA
ncbi:MAG: formate dehydrogenase accessory sulfurtransferase FdhD [Gammaproteobacteria bacterium]|nr:formate dehydrogenase accessory sulfurtransferase FdhD [Gammaproteobacteria bacterium]